ncbi:MAG: exodeoxyribonuclease VII large subunit [Pseudomonadota bacterium]
MEDIGSQFENQGPRVYTVGSLTEEIKTLLEDHFEFVWVEAEISNFRAPSSGHYYLVLKDPRAQIRAVMFRPQARYLKFVPEDGMKILAQGRVGVYAPRGEYQIILDYLEPLGVGALALAFEQLKKKLAEQGLFDESIKRPLPFLPGKVAVITSPTGAAIRDFLKIIHRRFANIEVTILPVKVQGEGAAEEMVKALETANRIPDVDVIVLTRGGGSLEDLWAFNQESLALAIRASRIPVVSAVGHEIDLTISDLAADMRAPTPSAAAEMLVVEKEAMAGRLKDLRHRLHSVFAARLDVVKQRLLFFSKQLRDPRRRIADHWMRLDEIRGRLIRMTAFMIRERKNRITGEMRALATHAPHRRIASLRQNLGFLQRSLALLAIKRLEGCRASVSLLGGNLKDLSPLAVLKRGYSITLGLPEERVLKSSSAVGIADEVKVILAEGSMRCRVEKTES